MKLNSTGQADVGMSFRLFSSLLSVFFLSPLGGRKSGDDGLVLELSQMCRLIYRDYIRQLLCTSAYYSPRPLSGYDRDRRYSR